VWLLSAGAGGNPFPGGFFGDAKMQKHIAVRHSQTLAQKRARDQLSCCLIGGGGGR